MGAGGSAASMVVRVPDGRRIAVEEFGRPDGPVVLYFHGWPACRLEAGLIAGLPVRLLAMDRPGYGWSTPQRGRTLLGWAEDVAAVVARLGIKRFYVVGLSGGGPFAAACAHAMPERVAGMALISPVPPAGLVPDRAPGVGMLFRLGRHPRLARRLLAVARPLLRRRLITPQRVVGGGLPDADRRALTPEVLAGLERVWREGLRGGIQGAWSDAVIYAAPWGFDLASLRVPTIVWTGGRDNLVLPEFMGPYRAIPGVRWTVMPDDGHYSLALRHGKAIVASLVCDATDRGGL